MSFYMEQIKTYLIASLIILFAAAIPVSPANAHVKGFSYVYLNIGLNELGGSFEVSLSDLVDKLDIDADSNGAISSDEFSAQAELAYDEFESHLVFRTEEKLWSIDVHSHDFLEDKGETYAQLKFSVPGLSEVPDEIDVEHSDAFWQNSENKVMLLIQSNEKIGFFNNESYPTLIFNSGNDKRTISLLGESQGEAFKRMVWQGIVHIAIGYDHVLFLLTLLVTTVLIRRKDQWEPVPRWRDAIFNVLTVVTLFTIAHSVTLSLAALDILRLPGNLVESMIALSIVAMALANIFSWNRVGTRTALFCLGLLHGFGFASVLAPLNISQTTLVVSLFAFNLGVELGQLAIVAVVFTFLFKLRRWRLYVPVIVWGVSAVAIVIGLQWFIRRTFDVCGILGSTSIGNALC